MAFYVGREIKFFSRSHLIHDAKFAIYGEKDLLKTFVGNYDAFHILTINQIYDRIPPFLERDA
jgi:hypothetical protein